MQGRPANGIDASPERGPGPSPRQFAYLSLAQPQRLVWTGALAAAFMLVTWFAWTREAPGVQFPRRFRGRGSCGPWKVTASSVPQAWLPISFR